MDDETRLRVESRRQAGESDELAAALLPLIAQLDSLDEPSWSGPAAAEYRSSVRWIREDLARAHSWLQHGSRLLREDRP